MVDIYVGSENTHWILHEKLLCYRSPFFRSIFYNKKSPSKSMGLPDWDDEPFQLFVGWLYSSAIPAAKEEKDLTKLFDLYLMAEHFQIKALVAETLETVRSWYDRTETYPGLRRVQYVYANTEVASSMRYLLVESIARMMVLGQGLPSHWDKALRKNGQLAVDIILAVQGWHIEEDRVPDARREGSVMPIVESAEVKKEEVKKEEGGEKKEEAEDVQVKQEDGEEENGMPNGVSGQDQEGEGQGEGQDEEEGKGEEQLTNGVDHDDHEEEEQDDE